MATVITGTLLKPTPTCVLLFVAQPNLSLILTKKGLEIHFFRNQGSRNLLYLETYSFYAPFWYTQNVIKCYWNIYCCWMLWAVKTVKCVIVFMDTSVVSLFIPVMYWGHLQGHGDQRSCRCRMPRPQKISCPPDRNSPAWKSLSPQLTSSLEKPSLKIYNIISFNDCFHALLSTVAGEGYIYSYGNSKKNNNNMMITETATDTIRFNEEFIRTRGRHLVESYCGHPATRTAPWRGLCVVVWRPWPHS